MLNADDDLRDIKLAFIAAYEGGEPLQPWLERFPQHARSLAELALVLDTDKQLGNPSEDEVALTTQALTEALRQVLQPPPSPASPGLLARTQLLGIALPDLAKQLQLGTDVLIKIDRGFIRLETLPGSFLVQLTRLLEFPFETNRPALIGIRRPALFYADHKPEMGDQQSFADAIRGSALLSDEQRARWLMIVQQEGLIS